MYSLIEIRQNIHCHWNYKEVDEFNFILEIDILSNYSQKVLGVLRGAF